MDAPNAEDFIAIVDQKTKEIDQKIEKLNRQKNCSRRKNSSSVFARQKTQASIWSNVRRKLI